MLSSLGKLRWLVRLRSAIPDRRFQRGQWQPMVAFLSRLVLRSFHNCDPFFCSSRSDLRLSPRALWPADETARLTFGIGDEDMSLQRLCKFHQPQGIDFESAESPRRDRASPDIDRHRPKLASPALVRFARLHARIGIFRLAESPLLFSAHVAFFWQRVFDEILQFTGFARTGRPRGGTFSDRFHFTALHIFVSQPEWRTAASERGEAPNHSRSVRGRADQSA